MKYFACSIALALWAALPALAAGETLARCAPQLINAAPAGSAEEQAARLACDTDRAERLAVRAEVAFGPAAAFLVRVVETAAPSGAAYVYDVFETGDAVELHVRSVPGEQGGARPPPLCQLRVTLAPEAAQSFAALHKAASGSDAAAYGAREETTLNADGSRTVKLIVDGHDIVSTLMRPDGPRVYSRIAGSGDPVADLNAHIIDIANRSAGWSCL
jgi:hypothetical protein